MGGEAVDQARALDHPFVLVFALCFDALIHQLRREARAAREQVEEVLRISKERHFALYSAWGTILRGWALTQVCATPAEGQVGTGIDEIRQGIAALRAIGFALTLPSWFASLAQACVQAGKAGEALSLIDEALGLVSVNGERSWEAELYRLKGEALSRQGDEVEAEACFQQAMDTARHQQARSWELRAAVSLCRLWRTQGTQSKREEAWRLLKPIYNWFSEGFGTPDLKEAKSLLDALARDAQMPVDSA
jgi:adenylate cyclase